MKLSKLILGVTLGFGLMASASAQTTMRISISVAQNSHQGIAIDTFAKEVERRTAGRYKIQTFYAGALGGERESIEAVQLGTGEVISCGACVNAAGAYGARKLAAQMGFDIPVYAKKRCVFSFNCREQLNGFPLLIDTSGVWVRPEGEGFIAGISPDDLDASDHADLDVDWSIFEDVIWPALASRVPAFEAIRTGRAWAGPYDMNLSDHNALLGRVPDVENGYLAAGFSGHGLQQAPAVGRGLAELILNGRYETLDLSPLGCERLL